MKRKTVLFIICVLIWCGLNWPINRKWLIIGLGVSTIIALGSGDIFIRRPHILIHFKRYFWLIYYLAFLSTQIIKANIYIIYCLCQPALSLHPGIVKVKTRIRSEMGLTVLANSITFSTGTCVVDIDNANGYIYVHWMDVKSQSIKPATELIVEKFEKILREVFD
ncbi:MAG: Na+/H+ antiporter subunit E [Candidatus Omnitrophota bacterium]